MDGYSIKSIRSQKRLWFLIYIFGDGSNGQEHDQLIDFVRLTIDFVKLKILFAQQMHKLTLVGSFSKNNFHFDRSPICCTRLFVIIDKNLELDLASSVWLYTDKSGIKRTEDAPGNTSLRGDMKE
ncbi:hypothetical protein GJ496_000760 [Pomphorhynchus laevis]|nr:hypothetical protein GJ496_000760 [Pomphorhynchus laevis]